MHYFYFHIGDYVTHTKHLNLIEDLAFRRLLDFYYLHEKPIRQHEIARQIGMREHEQEVLSVLEEFFVSTDQGYINLRADREIEAYKAKVEQASRAGKASAERRLNARSTDVQPTNNHKPITNNQINTVATAPESVDNFVWEDFLKIRKAKKAPMTATALEGIKREAEKAGWPLNDAIKECVVRGWQGFKAEWVEKRTVDKPDPGLQKLKEDEKLARPMPEAVRQMLKSAVKRI